MIYNVLFFFIYVCISVIEALNGYDNVDDWLNCIDELVISIAKLLHRVDNRRDEDVWNMYINNSLKNHSEIGQGISIDNWKNWIDGNSTCLPAKVKYHRSLVYLSQYINRIALLINFNPPVHQKHICTALDGHFQVKHSIDTVNYLKLLRYHFEITDIFHSYDSAQVLCQFEIMAANNDDSHDKQVMGICDIESYSKDKIKFVSRILCSCNQKKYICSHIIVTLVYCGLSHEQIFTAQSLEDALKLISYPISNINTQSKNYGLIEPIGQLNKSLADIYAQIMYKLYYLTHYVNQCISNHSMKQQSDVTTKSLVETKWMDDMKDQDNKW